MALLQGILALIARSLGSLFNTIFGWSVTALFGRAEPKEHTLLSVLVGAAAAWPLLLVGVPFPKIATFMVAFIPLSSNIPSSAVRPIWIGLALLVPIGVGVAVRLRKTGKRALWRDVLAGFRVTAGLALAFLFTLVSVPLLRLWSVLHKRVDEHVPAIAKKDEYPRVVEGLEQAWKAQRIAISRHAAPLWLTLPGRILKNVGGEVFRGYVPDNPAFFAGENLQAAIFPNDVMLRGRAEAVARAVTSTQEQLLKLPALQTLDSQAQDLEKRVQEVWHAVPSDSNGAMRQGAASDGHALHAKALDLARQLRDFKFPLADAQTLYRELIQLGRHIEGEPQLLERLER